VFGRGSLDRKLFKSQVAVREGDCATRTVDRKVEKGRLPPPDGVDGNKPFWWLSTLERHDRQRRRTAVRTPPGEGARKRKRAAPVQTESTT
jgi:hypothetical protein